MAPAEDSDFDPKPHATATLLFHILQKASQVGALTGIPVLAALALSGKVTGVPLSAHSALGALATTVTVRTVTFDGCKHSCALSLSAHSRCCAQVGTATLTAMGANKVRMLELEGIEERVYRLHFNEGQRRADRFANAGGFLGAAGAVALEGRSARATLGGFAAGTATGVLLHVASSKLLAWQQKGRAA